MRKTIILLLASAIVFGAVQLANAAEEALFDTKAAAAHVEKGITHLKEKKYDDAIKELEQAVSIDPDAEGYYYLGYAYYMKGRKDDGENRKKSMEYFDEAYELDPGFTPTKLKPVESEKAPKEPASPPEAQQPPAPATPPQTEPAEPAQQPDAPN